MSDFSTLADHLNALERLISPFADRGSRLKDLGEIMERRNLRALATLFWRGPPGAHDEWRDAAVLELKSCSCVLLSGQLREFEHKPLILLAGFGKSGS